MSDSNTINILILDDVEATNNLLRGVVNHIFETDYEEWQCKVFQAYKGRTALDTLQKNQINLAFLDIELPDRNGFEVLSVLNKEFPDSKAVMVSGHGTRENVVQAISKGVLGFILKPFNKARVKEPLDMFMRGYEKQQLQVSDSGKNKLINFVRQNYG